MPRIQYQTRKVPTRPESSINPDSGHRFRRLLLPTDQTHCRLAQLWLLNLGTEIR